MTGIVSCLRLPVILLVPCVILSCGGVKAAPFTARLTSALQSVRKPRRDPRLARHDAASHGMGVDHTRSTFRFGDHDMRLTDVKGHVVHAARDVCSNEPLAITSTAVAQRQGALGPRNWIS